MQESETVSAQATTERVLLPYLLKKHLATGGAVSLWRLPNSDEKHLLVSLDGVTALDDIVLEESSMGFIFSPFDNTKQKLFLRGDQIFSFKNGELSKENISSFDLSDIRSEQKTDSKKPGYYFASDSSIQSIEKNHYLKLVNKCLEGITNKEFEKVVPSRSQDFPLQEDFDPLATFNKLCETYPSAFVSLVSTSETGTWIGATPKLLF